MIRPRPFVELISIDPGFNGTGAVYWAAQAQPKVAVVVTPPRKSSEYINSHSDVARAHWIADTVFDYIGAREEVGTVVIEMPEFQAGAQRQMGWKTGDLQKLTMLVGVLAELAIGKFDARVMLVAPSEWKGQLPKDVVQRRLTQMYGEQMVRNLGVKTHAWDALGIGAWAWQQPWMKGRLV